jgi:putative FmdB family regulatory protein
MPIYEYVCSACGHRADILHGVNEPGPHFCPECGAEGSMRKAFAAPAIHFKGSGWAKRDRRSASASASKAGSDSGSGSGDSDGSAAGSSEGPSPKKDTDKTTTTTTKESSSSGSTTD